MQGARHLNLSGIPPLLFAGYLLNLGGKPSEVPAARIAT